MDVTEVLLPGVGLRYEFTNHEGDLVGVVAERTGDFELVVYESGDPDASRPVVRLNSEEADAVAEILGVPRIAERFAVLPWRAASRASPARRTEQHLSPHAL
ncbi:hypothetical protein [Streptomyces sp. SA15]|uniref:hypothetical protein n=1 Tax=Streptomyces sp. SA15 TaxID=934019 RepID=UPI00211BEE89|nr:hypothetical protein [Streptomyces sp. SA15]